MQPPNIVLNWPAIGVSVLVAFFLGFLWYSVLFGKTWARLMGFKMDEACKPSFKTMWRSMALQLLGIFLMTYVLAHTGQVWRPSVWGAGQDQANYVYGFYNAFFVWIGFYVPAQLGKVAWEMRPWKLFVLNSSHDLLNLLVVSQILAHWR